MRDTLLTLVALQKVDVELAALQKNMALYPQEIAVLEKQLSQARALVNAERLKLEELDKQRMELGHTVTDNKDKVQKWEARLTEQRSAREYSALAREIDISRKSQLAMREDIDELDRVATAQSALLSRKEEEYQLLSKDIQGKLMQLKKKLDEVQAQMQQLTHTRLAAAQRVEAGLLKRYELIRKKRLPAMVALLPPGTCGGCRISIRPQLYNQLMTSNEIGVCPSCSRMLCAEEILQDEAPMQ